MLGSGWGSGGLALGSGPADVLLDSGPRHGNDERIVYYTPRVGGLRIGLAYAPDDGAADALDPAGPEMRYALGGQSATRTFSADYLQRLGPVDLTVFGTYAGGGADLGPSGGAGDLGDAWGLGAQFAYGGFSAGGALLQLSDADGDGTGTGTGWRLTGSYASGPWTIGLAYARINQDPLTGGAAATGDEVTDYYGLGFTFTISPGITLGGGLQHYQGELGTGAAGLAGGPDGERTILLFGTAVSF